MKYVLLTTVAFLAISFPALAADKAKVLVKDAVTPSSLVDTQMVFPSEWPTVAENQIWHVTPQSCDGGPCNIDPVTTCDPTQVSCFSPNLCGTRSFGVKFSDKKCTKDPTDGTQDCTAAPGRTCDRYQQNSGFYECKTCS